MSSSRQGVWSQEDDDLLAHWQAHYGNRWSEVAKHISGKTGQQCAQRWRHRVNPNIRRAKWTEEEDSLLASLYQQHGGAWAVIARLIPGRTDQQCMGRWRRHLDPSVRRESWSPREDDILHRLADQYDRSWCLVARGLKGRTPQQCRTRWHYLASNPAAAAASKAAFEADPSSTTFQPARRTRIRPKNKKKRKATVRSHDHDNDDGDDGAAAGADLEEEFQDDMDYREEGGWDEPYMFEEGEDLAGDTRHPLRLVVAAAAAAAAATSALNAIDETAPSTSPPKTVPAASQPATRSRKSARTRETRAAGGRSRSHSGAGDKTHHRASKRRRTCSRSVYGNVNASEEEEISDMEEEEGVDALHIRRTQARRHLGGQVEEHKGAAAASPLVAVPTGLLIDNDDEDGGLRYWGGWAAPPPAMSHEKKKAQQSRAGGMGGRFPRNDGRNDIEDRRKTTETLEDVRRHAANALIFSDDDDDDDEGELIEHATPLEHDLRTHAGGDRTGRTSRRSTIIAHIAGEEHGDESDDDEEYYPSQRAKRRAMAVATSRGQGSCIVGAPPASVPFATTELLHHEHSASMPTHGDARFLKLNPTFNGVEGNAGLDASLVSKRMAPLQSPIPPPPPPPQQQQRQIQQPTSAVAAAHGSGGRPAARQGSPADRNTNNRDPALDNAGLVTPHRQKPALLLGGQLHAVAEDTGQQQQRHKSRDGEDGDVVCKDDGAEAATALISRYLHQRHLAHASPSPSPGLFNSADGMNDATASDALFFQGTQGVEITPPRLVQRRRARSYSLGVRSASHDDHAVAPPGPRVKLASPQENRYLQLLQSPPFAQHHGNVANEDTMMGEEYFMRGHYAAPSPQLNGLITPEWARAAAAATAAADSSREEARRASMDAVVRRLDVDAAVLGSAPSQGPPPPQMPAGGSVCPPHSQQRVPSHGHHVLHPIAASPTATTATTTTTTTTTTATMNVLPGTLKTTHDPALTPPKRTNNHHNAISVDPPLSSDRSVSISAGGIPPTTTAAAAALASASVSVQVPAATPQSCTATTVEQGDAGHSKYPLHTLPPPINLTPPSTGHLSGAHPLTTPHAATQQFFSNSMQPPTTAQRYFGGGAVGGENHALADRGTATRVLFPGQGPSTHSHSHSQQHEGGAVLDGRSSPPLVLGSLPMTTPSLTKAVFAAPESMPSQQRPPQEQRYQQQGATLASSMAALPAAGPLQVAVRPYLASHRFPGNGEGSGDGDGARFAAAAVALQPHVTPKLMPSPGTARDHRQPVGHTPSGSIATSVVYGEIGSDVVMKKGMAGGQTGLHPYLMQHAATSPGERGSLQPEPSTQWQLRWYTPQGQTPGVPAVSRGGQHYARVPSQLVGHVGMGNDACAATPPSTAACGAPVLQQTVVPPSGTLRQETSRPSSNAAGATPFYEGPMRMSGGKGANAPAACVEAQKKASGAAVKEQRPLTASQVRSKLRSLLGSA